LIASRKLIKHLNNKEYNTKDLTDQVVHLFAISFDIKNFVEKKKLDVINIKRFLNKYADYAFNSIYFNYFINFILCIFS